MNIIAAGKYLEYGYRIRRSCWHSEYYLSADCLDEISYSHPNEYYSIGKNENGKSGAIKHTYIHHSQYNISVNDLLADDWELITSGIRKHFNKKYGKLEYEDDRDEDNYIPPKSSYFDEEDE